MAHLKVDSFAYTEEERDAGVPNATITGNPHINIHDVDSPSDELAIKHQCWEKESGGSTFKSPTIQPGLGGTGLSQNNRDTN